MKRFENETLERFYDQDSARIFQDLDLVRCNLLSSDISMAREPHLRSTIRNVHVKDCMVAASFLSSAIIEDVEVDGLRTGADGKFLLIVFGAVFKHVTMKGKIGRILFNQAAGGTSFTRKQQAAFDAANAEFYRRVDWALDIRDAEFVSCDLRSVPARLVRRDPETQVVVPREKAEEGEWRKLDLDDTYWPQAFEIMLRSQRRDVVLVAPKRDPRFHQLLRGLQLLRKAGVADAD